MHRSDEEFERLVRDELARTQAAARPDRRIARDLHAAMHERHAAAGRWSGLAALFTIRIPAYQAMLGVAAVAILLIVVRPTVDMPARVVERQIVHVPVRDTVVVTRAPEAVAAMQDAGDDASGVERSASPNVSRRPIGDGVLRREKQERASAHSVASDSPRTAKDSSIEKPDVERPNRMGGLDNLQLLAHQRRGVTLVEDTAHRRFTFAVN